DEPKYAPRSLGENDRRHLDVQVRYAREVLGYPVWGLSPSSTVSNDGYSEFGVRVLGARGYEAGIVTPHATLLALGISPDIAVANLRAMIDKYDVYGDFGLYDAFDPESGAASYKYLVLDQAMSFLALANHLAGRSIQDYFAADPVAVRGFGVLGKERFFD
ncbi:MAG: glucoamylase family protein, partial [Pseudomonadota bacterium]|nr:glucoamylase family protein [Pseudomonadota bacterium]